MDNRSAADAQFDIAFSHMDLSHFNVWREKNFSDGGHKNFITGAGGYVQNYIFGYAGLRYNRAPAAVGMTIHPYLPPHNVTSLKLRGIAVAAARVSVKYNADGQFSAELLSGPAIQVCNVDSVCQKLTPSSTPAMFTWTSGETFKFTVL
eukprot:m.645286 g.645286  ORF g.645286 m.645286 type:complete len:149 (+) comp22651_c0_seq7:2181-2627(+)